MAEISSQGNFTFSERCRKLPYFSSVTLDIVTVYFRYDYENCASEPCNEMMKKLEDLISSASFPGTKFSNGGKTYTVKAGDNYAYTDPIDKSFASNQVCYSLSSC